METLAALARPLMGALGIGGAAGGSGLLASILSGAGSAAAPAMALPAATAGAGIANASPSFLSAVGLPDLAGSAGAAASDTGGFNLGNILNTGGKVMDVLGKAKQLSAPTSAPPNPTGGYSSMGGGSAAPPVNFSGGNDYATQLQKILKQHSGMGGGY